MPETPTSPDPTTAAPRPRVKHPPAAPGVFRRSVTTTRRWARDTFSREQLVSGLKQLAWVAPLTLLIWVYAEREQQDDADLTFPITVRSANPQFHARLVDPLDGLVQVTVAGPRSRLEQVGGLIRSRDPVVVEPAADGKTGIQTVPVDAILSRDARFRGLTVQGSTPAHVSVDVDPIDEFTLDVQLRDEDRAQVQDAVFTPPRVKVRLPRHLALSLRDANQGQLTVYADLGKLAPGKSTKSNVRVVLAGNESDLVRVDPATVSAAFEVRAADQEHTVSSVPVTLNITQTLSNENEVAFKPASVFDMKVRGSREALDRLRSGATRITATVAISREDINKRDQVKAITFTLPPDIQIDEDSQHDTSVRLTVTPRKPE